MKRYSNKYTLLFLKSPCTKTASSKSLNSTIKSQEFLRKNGMMTTFIWSENSLRTVTDSTINKNCWNLSAFIWFIAMPLGHKVSFLWFSYRTFSIEFKKAKSIINSKRTVSNKLQLRTKLGYISKYCSISVTIVSIPLISYRALCSK